jgi:SPP1 gp7 family putative phage head morphogenesis protein
MVGTEQARRIERAVAEAIKHRDRYAEERVKDLLEALDRAAGDATKQLARFGAKAGLKPWQEMRVAILKDLEKEFAGIARELESTWKVGIRANVEGAMRLGIEDGIRQMEALEAPDFQDLTDVNRNALVKRTFATIDRAAVDFLANYQVQLLGDVTSELASGIKRTVTQGVLTGRSIPEVARDIGRVVEDKNAFRRSGKTVFKTAQRRATLIARTETLRAHNEGRMAFYREVGVERVRWLAANDERICSECAPLNGMVFQIGEAPLLPGHPGCRCTIYSGPQIPDSGLSCA